MSTDQDGPGAGPVNSAILQAIEPYIDVIADRITERLERRRGRMISQHESDLGPRKHREAVKRRLDHGEGGAGRDGRRYLLTREAMREELARPDRRGRRGSGGAPDGPAPSSPQGGSPPSAPASGGKSRKQDLAAFERDVMAAVAAAEPRPRSRR